MSTVRRNRNHLARMTVMPGRVAVISLPAAPAAADTVVRCTGNPSALQPALAAASAGDTLRQPALSPPAEQSSSSPR